MERCFTIMFKPISKLLYTNRRFYGTGTKIHLFLSTHELFNSSFDYATHPRCFDKIQANGALSIANSCQ